MLVLFLLSGESGPSEMSDDITAVADRDAPLIRHRDVRVVDAHRVLVESNQRILSDTIDLDVDSFAWNEEPKSSAI